MAFLISKDKRIGRRKKVDRTYRKSLHDLDALFDRYYHAKISEGVADKTLESYRLHYNTFARYMSEERGLELDVRLVTADIGRAYAAWLLKDRIQFDGHKYKPANAKKSGLSSRSAYDYVRGLRSMFRWLAAEGLIDHNPLANVKNVRFAEREVDILTVEEIRALLATPDRRKYADFRDYVLMTLLLDGMLRIGEALAIQHSDIDFQSNTLSVRSQTSKSRKPRTVPIQSRTGRLLRELLAETSDFDSTYVFLANYGEPLTANHFRKRLRQYASAAGIAKPVRPHMFRHTGATMYLEAGGDIRHLQLILGQSDIRMVSRYTHVSGASVQAQHADFSPLNRVLKPQNKSRKFLR